MMNGIQEKEHISFSLIELYLLLNCVADQPSTCRPTYDQRYGPWALAGN